MIPAEQLCSYFLLIYWYKTSSVTLKVKIETVIGQDSVGQRNTSTIMGKGKLPS